MPALLYKQAGFVVELPKDPTAHQEEMGNYTMQYVHMTAERNKAVRQRLAQQLPWLNPDKPG